MTDNIRTNIVLNKNYNFELDTSLCFTSRISPLIDIKDLTVVKHNTNDYNLFVKDGIYTWNPWDKPEEHPLSFNTLIIENGKIKYYDYESFVFIKNFTTEGTVDWMVDLFINDTNSPTEMFENASYDVGTTYKTMGRFTIDEESETIIGYGPETVSSVGTNLSKKVGDLENAEATSHVVVTYAPP